MIRAWTLALLSTLAVGPALGQQPLHLPRVALVANTVPIEEWAAPRLADGTPHAGETIREGLRAYGWVDGKNIRFVHRSANGRLEDLPGIMKELAVSQVDVIVAIGPGANAAAEATKTIPIVMAATAAAVEIGLAKSLANPGGNLTGLSFETRFEIIGKRLELLKLAAPWTARVAFLTDGDLGKQWREAYKAAADAARVSLVWAPFFDLSDVDRAVAQAVREGAQAIVVADGVWVHRSRYQKAINAAASRHRLPLIHPAEGGARTGGLMSYAIDSMAQYRRMPFFIDRILRGAKPADLPMEQPGNPELVVNLKVARELGLVLPRSLLLQAARVIE